MSSPSAAEDAPVRSERPKLNLKPRDEGAAAKLASERAAAAKSVSFLYSVIISIRRRAAGGKMMPNHRHSPCAASCPVASTNLFPMEPMSHF